MIEILSNPTKLIHGLGDLHRITQMEYHITLAGMSRPAAALDSTSQKL
jgi:hypothetical protein